MRTRTGLESLALTLVLTCGCGGGSTGPSFGGSAGDVDATTEGGGDDAAADVVDAPDAAVEAAVDATEDVDATKPDAAPDAPDASEDAAESGDAADGADGGDGNAGACTDASTCDDGIACTVDACVGGACTHAPAPVGAPSACPTTAYCDPLAGCTTLPVCAVDGDCTAKLSGDPCKANIHCDHASARCAFSVLDSDGDGYPPIVCGGADCNDATNSVHPGAAETCNGVDDDCDGQIDVGATCTGLYVCQNGACGCPPANSCNGSCVDYASDPLHCGSCAHACQLYEACASGACSCTKDVCGGTCVDESSDPLHCGSCAPCPTGATCSGGACACPGSQVVCGVACTDRQTDASNCGACGNACGSGQPCVNGSCQVTCAPGTAECDGKPETVCETSTATSVSNCGSCGHECIASNLSTADVTCVAGTCAMTCRGENWDNNGLIADGCEAPDATPPGHDRNGAGNLGSKDCYDTPTASFSGWIDSDQRVHTNPTVPGYQSSSGSADDWWTVYASGGALCFDNYGVTISTSNGSSAVCYQITLWNGSSTIASTTVSGSGTATMSSGGSGLYTDGSTLYFQVAKICSPATVQSVHYSVSYHL